MFVLRLPFLAFGWSTIDLELVLNREHNFRIRNYKTETEKEIFNVQIKVRVSEAKVLSFTVLK